MASPESSRRDDPFGSEYATVSLAPSWGTLSIVCFVLCLPAEAYADWLPWLIEAPWQRPLVPVAAIFGLSSLGLAAALLGRRFESGPAFARLGLWLNSIALGVVLLTVLGIWLILAVR